MLTSYRISLVDNSNKYKSMFINFVIKKLKSHLIKRSLDYSYTDLFFVKVSNYFFKKNRLKHRFELTHLDSLLPQYKVVDLVNGSEKFFGYRKQGLMAFGNGIEQRGKTIGVVGNLKCRVFGN